jgi:CubicO group peptidase (beta-lactamase class C family)
MMINRIQTLFLALTLTLSVAQGALAQEAPLQGFDEYVNKALKDWEVPGVGIAIVKGDKVVLAKGYGVRKLGDPTPVDERTIFAIGSSSKAFTAAALAMLVDEGKIKWDDPVTKHLPGFELYDPYASKEMTVRDLLCHRSGLDRGDLMWYGSEYSRDEIIRRALSQAELELSLAVRLSEHNVSDRGSDHPGRHGQELGRFHQRPLLQAARHGREQHERERPQIVQQCFHAAWQD